MSYLAELFELLQSAFNHGASDLHLSAGLPPRMRVDGELFLMQAEPLEEAVLTKWLYSLFSENQLKIFEAQLELDFAFVDENLVRFRVHIFRQARGISAVFRVIPRMIPDLKALALPNLLKTMTNYRQGLVLVTGPTGSGKTTTLAALLNHINQTRALHIVTLEDPIEFMHESQNCLVTQREIKRDTPSFAAGLRSILREDPDVILVGELRDLATMRLAMTAAETGHLVFASLHTNSAIQTVNRLIDVFPAEEKALIRSMLAESLQAVIGQTLLKKNQGGRIAAVEIMICSAAIRNLIREGKIAQMLTAMQTGRAQGMQTLAQHVTQLLQAQLISQETAERFQVSADMFID